RGLPLVVVVEHLAFDARVPILSPVAKAVHHPEAVIIIESHPAVLVQLEQDAQPAAPVPLLVPGMIDRKLKFMLIEPQGNTRDGFEYEKKRLAIIIAAMIVGIRKRDGGTMPIGFGER